MPHPPSFRSFSNGELPGHQYHYPSAAPDPPPPPSVSLAHRPKPPPPTSHAFNDPRAITPGRSLPPPSHSRPVTSYVPSHRVEHRTASRPPPREADSRRTSQQVHGASSYRGPLHDPVPSAPPDERPPLRRQLIRHHGSDEERSHDPPAPPRPTRDASKSWDRHKRPAPTSQHHDDHRRHRSPPPPPPETLRDSARSQGDEHWRPPPCPAAKGTEEGTRSVEGERRAERRRSRVSKTRSPHRKPSDRDSSMAERSGRDRAGSREAGWDRGRRGRSPARERSFQNEATAERQQGGGGLPSGQVTASRNRSASAARGGYGGGSSSRSSSGSDGYDSAGPSVPIPIRMDSSTAALPGGSMGARKKDDWPVDRQLVCEQSRKRPGDFDDDYDPSGDVRARRAQLHKEFSRLFDDWGSEGAQGARAPGHGNVEERLLEVPEAPEPVLRTYRRPRNPPRDSSRRLGHPPERPMLEGPGPGSTSAPGPVATDGYGEEAEGGGERTEGSRSGSGGGGGGGSDTIVVYHSGQCGPLPPILRSHLRPPHRFEEVSAAQRTLHPAGDIGLGGDQASGTELLPPHHSGRRRGMPRSGLHQMTLASQSDEEAGAQPPLRAAGRVDSGFAGSAEPTEGYERAAEEELAMVRAKEVPVRVRQAHMQLVMARRAQEEQAQDHWVESGRPSEEDQIRRQIEEWRQIEGRRQLEERRQRRRQQLFEIHSQPYT